MKNAFTRVSPPEIEDDPMAKATVSVFNLPGCSGWDEAMTSFERALEIDQSTRMLWSIWPEYWPARGLLITVRQLRVSKEPARSETGKRQQDNGAVE